MALIAAYSKRNVFGLQPTPSTWNANITINSAGELAWTGTGSRIWARSPLGNVSSWSYRVRFRKPANPSGSSVGWLQPLNSSGSTTTRSRFGTSGQLTIDDLNGSAVSGAGTQTGLVQGNVYELEVYATAGTSQNIHARLWNITTGLQHGSELNGTDDFNALDNLRFGQLTGSPTLPDFEVIAFAFYDTSGAYPPAFDLGADESGLKIAVIGDSRIDMDSDQSSATVPDGPALFEAGLLGRGYKLPNIFYYGRGGKRINVADGSGKTTVQNIADGKNQVNGGSALDILVLHLGKNDGPQSDATINADLDTLLAAIDTSTYIYWVNETSKGAASTRDLEVNALIAAKLAAWAGDAEMLDWDTHIHTLDGGASPGTYFIAGDSTHNSYAGNEEKVDFIVAALPDENSEEHEGDGSLPLSVSLSGSGTPGPVAAATLGLSVTATGTGTPAASDSGSLPLDLELTGSGGPSWADDQTLTLGVTVTGTGTPGLAGDATLPLTVTLTGVSEDENDFSGDATLPIDVDLTGTGTPGVSGTGSLPLGLGLVGSGAPATTGAGTLGMSVLTTGSGAPAPVSSATLALGVVVTGTGQASFIGDAVLTISLTLIASAVQRNITVVAALGSRRWAGTTMTARRHGGHL